MTSVEEIRAEFDAAVLRFNTYIQDATYDIAGAYGAAESAQFYAGQLAYDALAQGDNEGRSTWDAERSAWGARSVWASQVAVANQRRG